MNGELVDLHGQPLRQSMGYSGGGTGFGGQLAEWLPAPESADVALLPSIQLGNARADDLVRNNGIAANAVEIHKDHIVGHMFRLSYRPNWRWLGMSEADSHAFIEDVEAAWMEFCDPVFGSMDVEGRRSFTEFIREGVGVHTFNGEIFVQPVWDTESTSLFRTKFKTISPKRVSTPGYGNLTLGDLVKTVATENGLKARVAEKLAGISITHVDQVAESDASLLSRLARTYNAVSKPAGGYWLFLEQGAGTTVSGAPLKTVTLTPSVVSSWNYQEGERGSSTGEKKKEKITVRYFDKADGRTKTATVEHDGSSVTSPYTQPEKETAEQQAKSKKTQAQRNSRKMTLTGPCRPSYVAMTAESGVVTSGFGKREDRRWLVESLAFSLSSSGFTFTFNLVAEIKSKKSGDKTPPDYFGTGAGHNRKHPDT